jgi:hypothetical protein
MDLGFGDRNNEIGQATANALLTGALTQEQSLDAELANYDRLLNDDDALEQLRQKRILELQQNHAKLQQRKALGHGTYQELSPSNHTNDVAKEFFQACKDSERLVVHFYRPSTRLCDVFHAHLSKLAPKHLETKFLKINVEGCDQEQGGGACNYLVEKLGIVIMPTLVLIKNRQAFHHIQGFDELGGTDDFSASVLAYVLGKYHGILDLRDDEEVSEDVLKHRGINRLTTRKGTTAKKGCYNQDDDDDEFE